MLRYLALLKVSFNVSNINFVNIGILHLSTLAAVNINNCTATGYTDPSVIEMKGKSLLTLPILYILWINDQTGMDVFFHKKIISQKLFETPPPPIH